MNLEPINNEDNSPLLDKGEILLPPEFESLIYNFQKGDRIKPTEEGLRENEELKPNDNYAVQSCRLSNIGDMSVWVVYIAGNNVRNPYYANHFKPYNEK